MHEPLRKFFADRGPHLAAMIAYFALLSLVPLIFLALALLGSSDGRTSRPISCGSSTRPAVGLDLPDRGRRQQHPRQRRHLGLIGGVFLLWTSLSLFSVLESAFNIVYGRPNRSFLHGRGSPSCSCSERW